MRRNPLLVVLAPALLGLGLAVLPALAADQTVVANSSDEFVPAAVTIDQGDTVTWNNTGGSHNVVFDNGTFEQPPNAQSNAWSVQHTFNSPGTFQYYCEQHGGPGGSGMAGTVTVNPADGTGTTTMPPGGAPPGGGPPGGDPPSSPPGADTTRPSIAGFALSRQRFRVGGRPTARDARKRAKRGSAFRFRLSEPATVRISISRVVKRGGRKRSVAKGTLVRRERKSGANTIPFSGRIGRSALPVGIYKATIRATDDAGNRSGSRRASFRVVAR